MPLVEEKIKINAPLDVVFANVCNFESYPKLFPEVKKASVLKQTSKTAEVDFVFHIMLDIKCRLKFNISKNFISWSLINGGYMKSNDGHWELSSDKKSTQVIYHLEITPTMWVPSSLIEELIKSNAPNMLRNLKKKCEKNKNKLSSMKKPSSRA